MILQPLMTPVKSCQHCVFVKLYKKRIRLTFVVLGIISPLFAEAYTGIYLHAAPQYYARPKAKTWYCDAECELILVSAEVKTGYIEFIQGSNLLIHLKCKKNPSWNGYLSHWHQIDAGVRGNDRSLIVIATSGIKSSIFRTWSRIFSGWNRQKVDTISNWFKLSVVKHYVNISILLETMCHYLSMKKQTYGVSRRQRNIMIQYGRIRMLQSNIGYVSTPGGLASQRRESTLSMG